MQPLQDMECTLVTRERNNGVGMTKMRLGLIQKEEDKLGKGQGSTKEFTIEILIGKSKMDLHGTKGEQRTRGQ